MDRDDSTLTALSVKSNDEENVQSLVDTYTPYTYTDSTVQTASDGLKTAFNKFDLDSYLATATEEPSTGIQKSLLDSIMQTASADPDTGITKSMLDSIMQTASVEPDTGICKSKLDSVIQTATIEPDTGIIKSQLDSLMQTATSEPQTALSTSNLTDKSIHLDSYMQTATADPLTAISMNNISERSNYTYSKYSVSPATIDVTLNEGPKSAIDSYNTLTTQNEYSRYSPSPAEISVTLGSGPTSQVRSIVDTTGSNFEYSKYSATPDEISVEIGNSSEFKNNDSYITSSTQASQMSVTMNGEIIKSYEDRNNTETRVEIDEKDSPSIKEMFKYFERFSIFYDPSYEDVSDSDDDGQRLTCYSFNK
uniref:Serine-rich adhesin for platelets-like n=1 Tax=Parastrongyloides trichosuri TaxID=131310 RepID=A0A0N4ZX88_PARTI